MRKLILRLFSRKRSSSHDNRPRRLPRHLTVTDDFGAEICALCRGFCRSHPQWTMAYLHEIILKVGLTDDPRKMVERYHSLIGKKGGSACLLPLLESCWLLLKRPDLAVVDHHRDNPRQAGFTVSTRNLPFARGLLRLLLALRGESALPLALAVMRLSIGGRISPSAGTAISRLCFQEIHRLGHLYYLQEQLLYHPELEKAIPLPVLRRLRQSTGFRA